MYPSFSLSMYPSFNLPSYSSFSLSMYPFFSLSVYQSVSLPVIPQVSDKGLQIQRPGFYSRCYQIFWKVVCLERGPLSLVSTTEELLGRKSSGSGLESREYGRRDPSHWPRSTLYPRTMALTSPTSGGRSVGIDRVSHPYRTTGRCTHKQVGNKAIVYSQNVSFHLCLCVIDWNR
jgi:hypothetical protein